MQNFADRLADRINALNSVACVGLDPVIDKFPVDLRPTNASHAAASEALRRFSFGVVDAVSAHVPIVKFQSACYERFGPAGIAALHASIAHAKSAGLLTLLDAKRGDIGISAEHYAAAAFDTPDHADADAITYSGYLGTDSIAPLLRPGRGVFVLVRTSNPGSDAFQTLPLADGRSIAEAMADTVHTLGSRRLGTTGLSDIGAVVGATKSAEAAALRARMPNTIFLIPGYGAQGGTLDDIRPAIRPNHIPNSPSTLGILVTASRSVIYPAGAWADERSWQSSVRSAAVSLTSEVSSLHA